VREALAMAEVRVQAVADVYGSVSLENKQPQSLEVSHAGS
jgi:hypothetical protein